MNDARPEGVKILLCFNFKVTKYLCREKFYGNLINVINNYQYLILNLFATPAYNPRQKIFTISIFL